MIAYAEWRMSCTSVWAAYRQWSRAPSADAGLAHAAYTAREASGRNGNAPRAIHFGRRLDHRRHQLGTGTFTGEMTLPDGIAIAPTGNAFDLTVRQTTV